MNQPSLLVQVKFKSPLSLEEIQGVIDSRIGDFRALKGLEQKYYFQDIATGEYGGLYVWSSTEDFQSYRDSELRKTIASAYQTQGEPQVEVLKVIDLLHG